MILAIFVQSEMTANKHPTHHKIKDNPAFVSCQTERVKHGHNQCEARSINRIKKWMNSDVDSITTVENENAGDSANAQTGNRYQSAIKANGNFNFLNTLTLTSTVQVDSYIQDPPSKCFRGVLITNAIMKSSRRKVQHYNISGRHTCKGPDFESALNDLFKKYRDKNASPLLVGDLNWNGKHSLTLDGFQFQDKAMHQTCCLNAKDAAGNFRMGYSFYDHIYAPAHWSYSPINEMVSPISQAQLESDHFPVRAKLRIQLPNGTHNSPQPSQPSGTTSSPQPNWKTNSPPNGTTNSPQLNRASSAVMNAILSATMLIAFINF